MTPKERAEEVGDRPEVQRWIKRFKRLAQDMPPDVWVFVGEGVSVVALDTNGEKFWQGTTVHRDAIIDSIDGGSWDGGEG